MVVLSYRTWRVYTFAVDDDIYTHLIPAPVEIVLAIENSRKNYGDVIEEQHLLESTDLDDATDIEQKIQSLSLGREAALEFAPDQRFGFWNSDGRSYSSKSAPE